MQSYDLKPALFYFQIVCAINVFIVLSGEIVIIKKLTLHTKKLNITQKFKVFNTLCSIILLLPITIITEQLMAKLIDKKIILSKNILIHLHVLI